MLNWVCHGSTDAMRRAAFPADEALDQFGERDCRAAGRSHLAIERRDWTAPELRARQTAELLGLSPRVALPLRDCDFGSWVGRRLDDVLSESPEAAMQWLNDPESAPHGGESNAAVLTRVGQWMEDIRSQPGQHVIVTHASVMRAAIVHALGGTAAQMRHVDIAALSVACTAWNGQWRLRHLRPWSKSAPVVLV